MRERQDFASLELLIVIVGLHSSGKTTLGDALSEAIQAPVVELGDGVRRAAAARRSTSLVRLAAELLQSDPQLLPRTALQSVPAGSKVAILVGPRTWEEFTYLTSAAPRVLTVGIEARPEVRLARWHQRNLRFKDTWDEREWQEARWGTAKLVGECDVKLQAGRDLAAKSATVITRLRMRSEDNDAID